MEFHCIALTNGTVVMGAIAPCTMFVVGDTMMWSHEAHVLCSMEFHNVVTQAPTDTGSEFMVYKMPANSIKSLLCGSSTKVFSEKF